MRGSVRQATEPSSLSGSSGRMGRFSNPSSWIFLERVGLPTGSLPRDAVSACSPSRPPWPLNSSKRAETGQ